MYEQAFQQLHKHKVETGYVSVDRSFAVLWSFSLLPGSIVHWNPTLAEKAAHIKDILLQIRIRSYFRRLLACIYGLLLWQNSTGEEKMVLSQRIHEAFKGAVERMTSPRTVSAFKEKGVLTPDEFVQAGDNLVSKCPTWSWEMGDSNKRKPYLPAEKQYLITRNGTLSDYLFYMSLNNGKWSWAWIIG
jgi:hypothetical protein